MFSRGNLNLIYPWPQFTSSAFSLKILLFNAAPPERYKGAISRISSSAAVEWSGVHVGQLRAWNTFRTEMGRADAEADADGDGEREKEPERLSHQLRKEGRKDITLCSGVTGLLQILSATQEYLSWAGELVTRRATFVTRPRRQMPCYHGARAPEPCFPRPSVHPVQTPEQRSRPSGIVAKRRLEQRCVQRCVHTAHLK